jgi:hypothetical protein
VQPFSVISFRRFALGASARAFPQRSREVLLHLAGGDAHDLDGVADHVGGRSWPLGPRGIGLVLIGSALQRQRTP